jgi:hypothetical protein
MARRSVATTAVIERPEDEDEANALHALKLESHENADAIAEAQAIERAARQPVGKVSGDATDLGFDPSDFRPTEFRGYKQPELPFRPEFAGKAHLWQFSWIPWGKKDLVKGQAEYGYSMVVRKGDSYRGHSFDDMFPPEAFDVGGGTLIGDGVEFSVVEKTMTAAQVLAVRPRVASEQEQVALEKETELRFRNHGENINPALKNIVETSDGRVTMKALEPGIPILRQERESRWHKD